MTATAYWIKGLKQLESTSNSWIGLLAYRILCDFSMEPSGNATKQSENILGIGANSYFYVGFVHPEFGRQVLAFSPNFRAQSQHNPFSVSPFDSGTLATDRLQFKNVSTSPRTAPDKKAFLQSYSFGRDYIDRFSRWARQSYPDDPVDDYVDAKTPSEHYCCEISVAISGSSTDCRCWIWEARIPKIFEPTEDAGSGMNEFTASRIWIEDRDLARLKKWCIENQKYTNEEKTYILDFLNDDTKVERVAGIDGAQCARSWLEVNQSW